MKKHNVFAAVILSLFSQFAFAQDLNGLANFLQPMVFQLERPLTTENSISPFSFLLAQKAEIGLVAWFVDGYRFDENLLPLVSMGHTYCKLTLVLPRAKLDQVTSETKYQLEQASWAPINRAGTLAQVKYPVSVQSEGIDQKGQLHCVAGVGVASLKIKNVLYNLGHEITVLQQE